jgi:hypothetical protein
MKQEGFLELFAIAPRGLDGGLPSMGPDHNQAVVVTATKL